MAAPFAIYARVSDVGDREGESFGSPAEQEAAGRAWAERAGVEVLPDPVVELNVSGAVPVNERELGRLIRECERGDLAGIIVRFEDRFARDLIEGALALQRLDACRARLVATATGFDSANLNSQSRLAFNLMMSVAQAQRERNREAYLAGAQRAARRGAYLAGRPPLGYSRDEQGRITPVPEAKPLIREAFKRRARGETLRAIRDYLRSAGAGIETRDGRARREENTILQPFAELTEQGVRHLLRNRAYLGEATVVSDVKGKPDVITNAHAAVVTHAQFERAAAAGGPYRPKDGSHSSRTRLRGLVYCESGHRMKVGAYRAGKPHYVCTAEGCRTRVGIDATRLDAYVGYLIQHAVVSSEPHVVAVLEGDDRYQRALDAVEAARLELETYRAEVRVSDVGAEAWKRDVAARQAALELARTELRSIKPTDTPYAGKHPGDVSAAMDRDANARFIARIVVHPVGQGSRTPVGERVDVYFVGAEEPATPLPEPLGLEDLAKLARRGSATAS